MIKLNYLKNKLFTGATCLALLSMSGCDITHQRAYYAADKQAVINSMIDPNSGNRILTTTFRPVVSLDGEPAGYILSSSWSEQAPDDIILTPKIARYSDDDNYLDKITNMRFVIMERSYDLRALEENKRSHGSFNATLNTFITFTQSKVKIPLTLYKLASNDPNCQFIVTVTNVTYTSNCSNAVNANYPDYGWQQANELLSRVEKMKTQ